MFLQSRAGFLDTRCTGYAVILAFLWCVGFTFGVHFFCSYEEDFVSLMRRICMDHVSIVGSTVAVFLPFLFSAVAVFINKPKLIYIVCFLETFLYGFAAYGLIVSFGDAGWLFRCLVLFSDICMAPILLWFWLQHIQGMTRTFRQNCFFVILYGVFVCILDYFSVSAFLAEIAV